MTSSSNEDQKVAEWMKSLGFVHSKRDLLWHLWIKNSDREIARVTPEAATLLYKAQQSNTKRILYKVEKDIMLPDEMHYAHMCSADDVDCTEFRQRCLTLTYQRSALAQIRNEELDSEIMEHKQ